MKKTFSDGEIIAGTRKRLGVTQVELAKRAGVSQKLISAIETRVNPMVEPSRSRIWNALRAFELERIEAAEKSELLAHAIGHARSKNFPTSPESPSPADVPTLSFVASLAADHARLTRRAAQQEELIRAYKRMVENLEKMTGLYQEALERQPELLRHWENEFRLRKEAEQSFRKELAALQEQLAQVPPVPQNQEKDAD